MARMYSRAKGKSGSKKPLERIKPSWLRYTSKELEILIAKLAKEGKTPSQIGLLLRDVYGVPDVKVVMQKSITQILKEKNLLKPIPEDLLFLIKKAVAIRNHLEKNKKDMSAKRGLIITESKIYSLAKYYKRTGKLPVEWKYDPESAKLMV